MQTCRDAELEIAKAGSTFPIPVDASDWASASAGTFIEAASIHLRKSAEGTAPSPVDSSSGCSACTGEGAPSRAGADGSAGAATYYVGRPSTERGLRRPSFVGAILLTRRGA